MDAQPQTARSLTLLDLPRTVLQDILARCGPANTRTGICLPFVCRGFRDALQDLQHVQLWGNVAPLCCVRDHVYSINHSLSVNPKQWLVPSLREWLEARATAIDTLHIKRPGPPWDIWHWKLTANTLWPLVVPNLKELLIDLPCVLLHLTEHWTVPLASLSGLQCLQLNLSFDQPCATSWGWLQALRHLTSIHLSRSDGFYKLDFSFTVLGHLTLLEKAVIRIGHDGDVSPLAGLPALRSLSLSLPQCNVHVDTHKWESISGLTALEELVMFPPIDPRHFNEGFPTVPSDAALNQLTKLTCLGLQVAGVEPGNGSIQASVSRLRRLARLCVAGTLEGNVCELPPGFGGLSTLTLLRFATVHFSSGVPLSSGLQSLRVLEVASCSGTLCIACPLRGLQCFRLADVQNLELSYAFVSSLQSRPDTRCELTAAWFMGDEWQPPDMVPPVSFQLPHLRSLVIANPPSWRGLPMGHNGLALGALEELDLQGCDLHSIPAQLKAATQLRQLRLGADGNVLRIMPEDLQTLSAMRGLTFLSITKPRPHADTLPAGPFEERVAWDGCSLQNLCCILWQLRDRTLTVVLKEPCDVVVPLAAAAAFPADALGRCALTTWGVLSRFQSALWLPWGTDSDTPAPWLWAWMSEIFPGRDARFADIAEVDGAAAMWAAVPGDVADWLQLQPGAGI